MKLTDTEKSVLQEALDNGYTKVKRSYCGAILFTDNKKAIGNTSCFDDLFSFITNEEEYDIADLLNKEN